MEKVFLLSSNLNAASKHLLFTGLYELCHAAVSVHDIMAGRMPESAGVQVFLLKHVEPLAPPVTLPDISTCV